jgi:hypothetical protein
MTSAANLNPYEQETPYTPDIDEDFGGALAVNLGGEDVPDETFPDANKANTAYRIACSHALTKVHTVIDIDIVAGNYAIVGVTSVDTRITLANVTTIFTLARFGGGDAHGDAALSWAAAALPPALARATAHVTTDVDCAARAIQEADTSPGGVATKNLRVRTRSFGGAGVDAGVQVHIR